MQFYGISFMLPYKQSGQWQDVLYQAQFWPSSGDITIIYSDTSANE